MKIKFKKPDPRAGMVVQMDSNLGYKFIEQGLAEQVAENVTSESSAPADVQQAEQVADSAAPAKSGKGKK
ncbi:hypothetical protein [Aquilutibacter rugosus]|uniref:hypothetical protein n=1 Tax=Aquilutibacter rugosus TaxID=3115820 RepID=UPI002F411197